MMHKSWRSIEEKRIVFGGHPSNFKVTRAEKWTIWIQFEITRPVAAIKSLRFALLVIQMVFERTEIEYWGFKLFSYINTYVIGRNNEVIVIIWW